MGEREKKGHNGEKAGKGEGREKDTVKEREKGVKLYNPPLKELSFVDHVSLL